MADIKEYTFIKNIEKIVKGKLQELHLSSEIPLNLNELKKNNRRFYAVPCKKNHKERVFLKILVVEEEWPARCLQKDLAFTKLLTEKYQDSGLNFPLFVEGDSENYPYWFLHQFLPGPLVGYFYEVYEQGLKKESLKKIVDNLIALQSIPIEENQSIFSKISITKRGLASYLKEIDYTKNLLEKRGEEKGVPFDQIITFLQERKELFENDFVLSHGDYTLANFFLHQDKVYVSDWEHVNINNSIFDIAHLWRQTWQYRQWRKELLVYFFSKLPVNKIERCKELFSAVSLVEALGELAISSKICPPEYKVNAKKAAQKTIPAAFQGFNDLINL